MALKPMPSRGAAPRTAAPAPAPAHTLAPAPKAATAPVPAPAPTPVICTPSAFYEAVLMHVAYDERAKWGEWAQALATLAAALPMDMVSDQSIEAAIGSNEEAAKAGVCLALMDLHRAQFTMDSDGRSKYGTVHHILNYSYDLEDDVKDVASYTTTSLEFVRYCEALIMAMRQQMRSYWSGIECMDTQTLIKCALRGAIRMGHMAAWLNKQPPGGTPSALAVQYCSINNSLGLPAADPRGWMEVAQWASLQDTSANVPLDIYRPLGDSQDCEEPEWGPVLKEEFEIPW